MSYQVIARKWRPKSFEELVGQAHVAQTLLNAMRNNRIPHALLFTGARGVGKTSSARIFAKSLRCPNATDWVPCGVCRTCQDIANGSSLDVMEIDGASNNGVDAIRELRESVAYMPSTGKYKIYIIDEVHMLSTSAFNALLKTLEEPPAHVIFIFATTEPQKIPVTILSRCQRFDFRRIPTRQIAERLALICKEDGVKAETEALWVIARQAEGSLRDSQSLLDQAITFSDGNIQIDRVIEILGLTDRHLLTSTLESLVARDSKAILDIAEKMYRAGSDPRTFAHDLLEEIRHLLLTKMNAGDVSQIVDLPDGEIEFLRKLAARLSEEDIHLLFDMALKGGGDIPRSQNQRIVLEMMLLRMASAPRIVDLIRWISGAAPTSQILKAPDTAATSTTASSPATSAPTAAPPMPATSSVFASASASASVTVARWQEFVEKLKSLQPMLAAKIERASVVKHDKGSLVLGIKKSQDFIFKQVNEKKVIDMLVTYLKTYWGKDYAVSFQLVEDDAEVAVPATHALSENKKAEEAQQLKKDIENHPLIKKTQDIFKTQIKQIKEPT